MRCGMRRKGRRQATGHRFRLLRSKTVRDFAPWILKRGSVPAEAPAGFVTVTEPGSHATGAGNEGAEASPGAAARNHGVPSGHPPEAVGRMLRGAGESSDGRYRPEIFRRLDGGLHRAIAIFMWYICNRGCPS